MAARRSSHESPEGPNWVEARPPGVEGFAMAGENVGMTASPPERGILQGWIHSPSTENLLRRASTPPASASRAAPTARSDTTSSTLTFRARRSSRLATLICRERTDSERSSQ
jgi:hypothetical protein